MKQITSFMSEISDEFKVIVVDAVRSLCLKFPAKQSSILTFLSGTLRDEGNYDFKRAVVEAIFDMIKFIPDCVEDCSRSPLRVYRRLRIYQALCSNSASLGCTGT